VNDITTLPRRKRCLKCGAFLPQGPHEPRLVVGTMLPAEWVWWVPCRNCGEPNPAYEEEAEDKTRQTWIKK